MYLNGMKYIQETAMEAQTAIPFLTVKIVGSYLRHHTVGASELPDLVTSVHRALGEAGRPNPPEILLTPAVSVRQSVRHDYVVCLDCGHRGRTLRRHITTRHGFSRDEYLRRWGLQPDHSLTAPAYSEQRSTLAKQPGLGRKPKGAATTTARESGVGNGEEKVAADHATPGGTTLSGSNSDVVNEAALKPTKTRQRRTRSRA